MIVAVGGRPRTGKTTLAKALATVMSGVLLDMAALQRVLFPRLVPASPERSDRAHEFLLQAAVWNLEGAPEGVVVLDGKPLTRPREAFALRRFASGLDQPLRIIECVCPDGLAVDRARTTLACTDQFAVLNKVATERVPDPRTVIDTSLPVDQRLARVLECLGPAPVGRRAPRAPSRPQAGESDLRRPLDSFREAV